MTDPRLTKWADTLVNHSLSLKPDEQVLIRTVDALKKAITAFKGQFKA